MRRLPERCRIWVTLLAVICAGASCSSRVASTCETDSPSALMPKSFDSIRIGMTKAEAEAILGPPDYSPIDGQYYFSTGGDCEVAPDRMASCGFIIEYRDHSKSPGEDTGRIVECRWGGIGE